MYVLLILLLVLPAYGHIANGDIRLVGGSYQWEGRVEIYFSGTWGTITDIAWTNNDAQAVCNQIGHFKPGATAHSNAYFSEGYGSIHLSLVECSGFEHRVFDCETETSASSNSHSFDVGVKCLPATEAYREGDIRLVGGLYNWEGRVEIYWMEAWGTISDSSWSRQDAVVVCRQLQHLSGSGVAIPCCDSYGEGVGNINIRNVRCVGSESNITSCPYHNNTVWRNHQYDVRVQCQQGSEVKEGDIQLIEHNSSPVNYIYGRVEIFIAGIWGSVSDIGAHTNEAKVVCRQLGYNTYRVSYSCCGSYGTGTGPIHLRSLQCNGLEYRLSDCDHNTDTVAIARSRDWGVWCYTDGPEPGDIRLSSYVELFLSGVWMQVTTTKNNWMDENSQVICKELGYMPTGATWSLSGYTTTTIKHVNNVVCNGSEAKLSDCSFNVTSHQPYRAVDVNCIINGCSHGDVRLVGGGTEAEGRVELCVSNRWGTVCDNQWTEIPTTVLCRYLGFSDITGDHYTSERFGKGTGPIHIDYIRCSGPERSILNCQYFTHYYGCSHSDDVGVSCQPAPCTNGQLQLTNNYNGRVEICSNQRWESINRYYWTPSMARVVCIELGFSTYYYWNLNYGRGGGPIHKRYYHCIGKEKKLSECSSDIDTTLRSHRDDVGIFCFRAGCVNWEMRLVEGQTEWEGRLEVCYNRRWGTVGSERWSQVNSRVVCNTLGYDSTEEAKINHNISQSLSKRVHFQNIACQITARTLQDCNHVLYTGSSSDITDVIVHCQKSSCINGDLKLVGSTVTSEGRLQICRNGKWTAINAEGWTHYDTQVACKQLGYANSDIHHYTIGRSLVSLPAILKHISCRGTEQRLIDCHYSESTSTIRDYDIGISCGTVIALTTTIVPTTTTLSFNSTVYIYSGIENATTQHYNCYNCTGSSGDSGSNILMASLAAVLCFSAVIGVAAGCLIIAFIKKRKRSVHKGNTSINDNEKDEKISENISYIPSTHAKTSSEGAEALYYDSIKKESAPSCQQPLPLIPQTPETQDDDTVNSNIIYETCQ